MPLSRISAFRSWLVVLLLAPVLAWGGAAEAAAPAFSPGKFAAIVVDASSGEVFYSRKAVARRYPASLTKVMTLYLAFDALDRGDLKLTDKVVMSPRAAAQPPSKLGLRSGDHLTVAEALDVLVVKSANDVATALAEKMAGSEAAFARRMTAKARQLGMQNTTFRNASGLPDPQHVSTALDLAILGHALLRDHPDRYAIFNQQQTSFRGRLIRGHNALLKTPGVDGMKTGFIRASGFNLLTSGVGDGHRFIAVVLGANTASARDQFMRQLLRASFTSMAVRFAGNTLPVATLLGARDPFPQAGEGLKIASAWPASTKARSACAERSEGCWAVQVGAYSDPEQSRLRLAELAKRYPRRFGEAVRRIVPTGRLHQARFAGFGQSSALDACEFVRTKGEACLVVNASL
jgi:D-alanyl-D-alanine carboxypeptidase (penicillin-binding protein 5/6)